MINKGDTFGFQLRTLDNTFARGNVTISNFNVPVSEAFTIGGSIIALGFGWWMKCKPAVSQKV